MGTSIGIKDAYAATARMGIREVVRQLNHSLGATLVAALAGSKDAKIVYRWARDDGPEPRPESQARLLLAHRAWVAVSQDEGDDVARLWFVGANPWLGEISPIEAISQDRAEEVIDAASAMTEDRLGG